MASLSLLDLKIRELIFAAPDVDRDVFASRAELIKRVCEGVTIYASSADKALQASKVWAGGYQVGDVPIEGPFLLREWI